MTIKKNAVTIIEVIVVIIIIGLVLAFAIPNYQRNIARAYEKAAFDNLNLIKSSMGLYKAKNGSLPASALADAAAINATLGIAIIADNLTYSCVAGAPFICTAQSTAYPWALSFQTVSGALIRCTAAGGCPTCGVAGSCYESEQNYMDF
jgi:prepilin-type N-terminal cleavage/methylation domain-containing protein